MEKELKGKQNLRDAHINPSSVSEKKTLKQKEHEKVHIRKVEVKMPKHGKNSYDDVVAVDYADDGTRVPEKRLTYNLDRCSICFMHIH